MSILASILAVAVSLAVGRMFWPLLFDDEEDFWGCVRSSFTPDIISLFCGTFWADAGRSTRLGIFLWFLFGAGAATYFAVEVIWNALSPG